MTCRDFQRMADPFLAAQTTTETNHDLLRHVDACPSCRSELEGRRRLRAALRNAFDGTSELDPGAGFAARLRAHVREEADRARPRGMSRRAWLGLAAGVVAALGVTGGVMLNRWDSAGDDLARDAIGDHRYCALNDHPAGMPVALPDAAAQFDRAYRVLLTAPPDEMSAPGGLVRVVDRHACVYDGRRFGHVIMHYRGHVVSLLMTGGRSRAGADRAGDPVPHAIGQPANGLSVVSLDASDRSILLVGDLSRAELTELSAIVARPLAEHLAGSVDTSPDPVIALALPNTLTALRASK